MSSKRRLRARQCGDKVNHGSFEQARAGAWSLRQQQGGPLLVPYGCRFCGGVHIGHAPALHRHNKRTQPRQGPSGARGPAAAQAGDGMSRSKAIGTAAESAVVRYLRDHGFPAAERRALRGQLDAGDVTGLGSLVVSVKGGRMAESAAPVQVDKWMGELRTQTANANADYGLLVVKRIAVSHMRAGLWWAWLDLHTIIELSGGPGRRDIYAPDPLIRMTLADAVALLRHAGYGDPVEGAT
jgi:hypothetical protein